MAFLSTARRRLGVGILAGGLALSGLAVTGNAPSTGSGTQQAYATLGGGGSVGGYYSCYWTRSGRVCYWVSTGTGGGGSW
jgi:hypothetical protein